MKNPFVMMALMAAAMGEAFRENAYRDAGMSLPSGGRGSRGPVGKRNPAGTKAALRFYKAKHGMKASSVEDAQEWYSAYLAKRDAAARQRDADRKARRSPALRLAA